MVNFLVASLLGLYMHTYLLKIYNTPRTKVWEEIHPHLDGGIMDELIFILD